VATETYSVARWLGGSVASLAEGLDVREWWAQSHRSDTFGR
jgi:hypothetical protein